MVRLPRTAVKGISSIDFFDSGISLPLGHGIAGLSARNDRTTEDSRLPASSQVRNKIARSGEEQTLVCNIWRCCRTLALAV